MKPKVIPAILALALALSRGFAADQTLAPTAQQTNMVRITPEYLATLSEEVRTNHPQVRASMHRARAATANVKAVRTWEDPMARIGAMGARTENRQDDGDLIYGVEQKLPLFGKPQAERRMAQAEADMETSKIDLQFQTLRRDLAKAVFRAGLADRAVQLDFQDLAWLDTLVNSVETKYQNRTATLIELIQAQNERTRRVNLLRTDESKAEHERVAINRFLNRDSAATLPVYELPAVATRIAFTPRLMELALGAEPKLHVMRRELKRAEAAGGAAKKQRLPEVSVGAQGRTYSGDGDFRSAEVMVSFTLPWGNRARYGQQVVREQEKARATELDIENESNGLHEEVHQLTIMIENARREAVLYRDEIVPRWRSGLDTAHSAWFAGTGMLRDVIEARRMLTEAELMYARAVSEQHQAMSELVLCCGIADFESLQMIGVKEEPAPKP